MSESFVADFQRRDFDKEYVRKSELQELVRLAVSAALADYQHKCILNLEPEQIKQVDNIFTAIREIGGGDIGTGVETIRDNHKMLARYCRVTGKIGTTVISMIVISILTVAGSAFLLGLIEKARGALK